MCLHNHLFERLTRALSQYIPGAQDPVVGVVIARSGENYRVDIGAAHPATLDALAFEGASKRNRPNLKVPVFARDINTRCRLTEGTYIGWLAGLCPRIACP